MSMSHRTSRRVPILARSLVLALAIGFLLGAGGTQETAFAQDLIDVTDDAVQTFYQGGVPHTDGTGRVTTDYDPDTSFFPIGAYYPDPCHASINLSWPAYEGGGKGWEPSYTVFVGIGESFVPGDRMIVRQITADENDLDGNPTTAFVFALPTDTVYNYRVYPNLWEDFEAYLPHAQGTFNLECPPGDAEDPNIVATLADGGFNLAVIICHYHPQHFLNLKQAAGVEDFKFVIGAQNCTPLAGEEGFSEDLFRPIAEGGQGYSQHPDIYGWQTDDEPVHRNCDQETLDYLTQMYDGHKDLTDQVIFHVEGAPWYGWCPQLFDESVNIGDVANHDGYLGFFEPVMSVELIAYGMALQTNAVSESKPSWFTSQGWSYETGWFPRPWNRAAVYTAIVHGATGIWYFIPDGPTARKSEGDHEYHIVGFRPTIPASYPEANVGWGASEELQQDGAQFWIELVALNDELASLEPVLLQSTSTEAYEVFVTQKLNSWSPIRTILKSIENDHYLIAVNMDSYPTDAEFHFSDTIPDGSVEVLFEGSRQPATSDNVLSDSFDGFGVHVYHFQFTDTDSDGVHDSIDNCVSVPNPGQEDSDSDGVGDACDNCVSVPNPGQEDSDGDGSGDACDNCVSIPNPGQENADAVIDNGPGIPENEDDVTVANAPDDDEGDACETDGDADNDGLPDSEDTNPLGDTGICAAFTGSDDGHPNPAGGDITNDDNGDGNPAPPMGSDSADNGPSWDTDNDGVPDGAECALGHDPRNSSDKPSEAECGGSGDTDSDGLQDNWETCKWGTNPALIDSDGDTLGDCKEAADVNGDGVVDFVTDTTYYAKAALLWPCPECFGRTMDFDLNGDGIVDFVADLIQETRFALTPGLCQ
jgi:hypothetical protein